MNARVSLETDETDIGESNDDTGLAQNIDLGNRSMQSAGFDRFLDIDALDIIHASINRHAIDARHLGGAR